MIFSDGSSCNHIDNDNNNNNILIIVLLFGIYI